MLLHNLPLWIVRIVGFTIKISIITRRSRTWLLVPIHWRFPCSFIVPDYLQLTGHMTTSLYSHWSLSWPGECFNDFLITKEQIAFGNHRTSQTYCNSYIVGVQSFALSYAMFSVASSCCGQAAIYFVRQQYWFIILNNVLEHVMY